jgi:hypothetical protein
MGRAGLDFPINAKIIRDDYGNKIYELIDLGGRVWVFDYTTGVSKSLEELDLSFYSITNL